jgi:hypothetical protein
MTTQEISADTILVCRAVLCIFVLMFLSGVFMILKPLKKIVKKSRKATRRERNSKKALTIK